MSQENELPKDPNKEFENLPVEITNSNNDNLGTFITNILKIPAVHKILESFAKSEENTQKVIKEKETNFHNFLKHIDLVQKIYNILYVLFVSGVVCILNKHKVIDTKVSETVLVFIIGLSTQNAITSFFNSKKKD